MTEMTTKKVLSLVATKSNKIRDLPFKDGQLIFIYDLGRIAFDFKGGRTFYNQIVELETEAKRLELSDPISGYYFILGTGCLWFYKDKWIQITEKPENILYIGNENFPEIGQENKLYINKTKQNISIWDDEIKQYVLVANHTINATKEDIENLFNGEINE